jgi:hypothetical protein
MNARKISITDKIMISEISAFFFMLFLITKGGNTFFHKIKCVSHRTD